MQYLQLVCGSWKAWRANEGRRWDLMHWTFVCKKYSKLYKKVTNHIWADPACTNCQAYFASFPATIIPLQPVSMPPQIIMELSKFIWSRLQGHAHRKQDIQEFQIAETHAYRKIMYFQIAENRTHLENLKQLRCRLKPNSEFLNLGEMNVQPDIHGQLNCLWYFHQAWYECAKWYVFFQIWVFH